jgi:hypothetical protein
MCSIFAALAPKHKNGCAGRQPSLKVAKNVCSTCHAGCVVCEKGKKGSSVCLPNKFRAIGNNVKPLFFILYLVVHVIRKLKIVKIIHCFIYCSMITQKLLFLSVKFVEFIDG